MTLLNRKKQPQLNSFAKLVLASPIKITLDNGMLVYMLHGGTQELTRIDLIFKAGSWYQPKTYVAYSVNKLLKEGTRHFSSNEISEKLDFYGTFLDTIPERDNAYVMLYSLNKHLDNTLPLLEEIVKAPVFPEEEIQLFINKEKQRFTVSSQKVKYIARTNFQEVIFGPQHPYGVKLKDTDFDQLEHDTFCRFHEEQYTPANCTIIVSGLIPSNLPEKLNALFGKNDWGKAQPLNLQIPEIQSSEQHFYKIIKEDSLQSGIRIGRPLFNRSHPDYLAMSVLNNVLGGYFGSRLMTNLREDKGYTYGVGSGIVSFLNSGYFFITSELGSDYAESAVTEIMNEIKILREELVPESELELVKNYIYGSFLRSIDVPVALADKFRNVMEHNLDFTFYERFLETVKNITSEELRQLAQKYLQEKDLWTVMAGR